jgi:hypothetical protein
MMLSIIFARSITSLKENWIFWAGYPRKSSGTAYRAIMMARLRIQSS